MKRHVFTVLTLFGLIEMAGMNDGLASPSCTQTTLNNFATDYQPLAKGRQLTHTCPPGETAAYIVFNPNDQLFDLCERTSALLSRADSIHLTCLSTRQARPLLVKRLRHANGGTGFRIVAGSNGLTQNLTLEAL